MSALTKKEIQRRCYLKKKGVEIPPIKRGKPIVNGYGRKLFECSACGLNFIRADRPNTDPKKSKLNFCSRTCYAETQKGTANSNFKGHRPCKKCGLHIMGAQRVFCSKICLTTYRTERAAARAPQDKLNRNMRRAVVRHLAIGIKAERSWRSLVGFGSKELMDHLELKFQPGMTWQNYGSYWHLDHIKPVAAFFFSSPEDHAFKECWSLSNLQPLTSKENRKKSSYYDGKFMHWGR